MVQATRQQFREVVPSIIDKKFTRKMSEEEYATLFRGMGKTDIASLANDFKTDDILGMLSDPKQLDKATSTLESHLQIQDPGNWKLIERKAQQLATYMNTGKTGTNLLSNANAVAHLLNERVSPKRAAPDAKFISAVDHLVSLYAMKGLSQQDQKTLKDLVTNEKEGVSYALAYLTGQRVEEMRKAKDKMAFFNHYKGYIPSLPQDGVSLLVANDRQSSELLEKSYKRVGDYQGSVAEGVRQSMGYYMSPASARSPFNQGIMQNVQRTASGVDAGTGLTNGLTAGRITNPIQVKQDHSCSAPGDRGYGEPGSPLRPSRECLCL